MCGFGAGKRIAFLLCFYTLQYHSASIKSASCRSEGAGCCLLHYLIISHFPFKFVFCKVLTNLFLVNPAHNTHSTK